MKALTLLFALSSILIIGAPAQDSPFRRMEKIGSFQSPIFLQRNSPSAEIRDIQRLDARWGIAYTSDAMFRTSDGGATWGELTLGVAPFETISTARFADSSNGYAIVSSSNDYRVALLRTVDGGDHWERLEIELRDLRLFEAEVRNGELTIGEAGRLSLVFPVTTSSNFSGTVTYGSGDGGLTWNLENHRVDLRAPDAPNEKRSGSWSVVS